MCGFTGYFSSSGAYDQVCQSMLTPIHHRGPDDEGVWTDAAAGIALGHKRLSIQDLSPLGHQPMLSESGRYVIAYNGEVYNFKVLQQELKEQGCCFRGHSDTEVILAAIETWGVEVSLTRFVGMFAFALWDTQENVLTLARDRMGEKPLYYGWQGGSFLFGSELKALRQHPSWVGEINRGSLSLYMRHNYIPAPYSIFSGVYKLNPGCFLQINGSALPNTEAEIIEYWSPKQVAETGVVQTSQPSDSEQIKRLDTLLRQTIRGQMISDVPLGAFLSGGIDSSTVVALMQQESEQKVKTFTIGFHEEGYNEAEHAKAVAKYLDTEHTELYITPEQAMEVIPKLPLLYDEPFSDSSQIPTYLVSEMTKQHVTVSLSGDGGDELFCGYSRYFLADSLRKKLFKLPQPIRKIVAGSIQTLPASIWDSAFSWLLPVLARYGRSGKVSDKVYKAAELLKHDENDLYRDLISHWKNPSEIVLGGYEPPTALTDKSRLAILPDYKQKMQFIDMISYLPDDILVKVDRAAMGVSLETRVPFLDHRVVEFAWSVPMQQKVRNDHGKWLLRQVLYQYVPQSIIDRPKMGFGVPIGEWLKGSLRDWAEALLDEKRLEEEGFFNVGEVRKKWLEHLSGDRNWQGLLWDVLMFQAWYECWNKTNV